MRIAFIKPSESEEIIDVLLTAYGEWRTAKNRYLLKKDMKLTDDQVKKVLEYLEDKLNDAEGNKLPIIE